MKVFNVIQGLLVVAIVFLLLCDLRVLYRTRLDVDLVHYEHGELQRWFQVHVVDQEPKVSSLSDQIDFLQSQACDMEYSHRNAIQEIQMLQAHVANLQQRLDAAHPLLPLLIFDLNPSEPPRLSQNVIHLHCTEELNGGGYREGKFVYLKEYYGGDQ